MKRIHVAIIDDGVSDKLFNLSLIHNIEVNDKFELKERLKYDAYKKSHGTICAAIIKKYCSNIFISSIKALDEDRHGNKKKLIKAIEWCIDNNVDIINLSIGSINIEDKDELRKIIDEAHRKNISIIAANSNCGTRTYPACFNKVIGVKCDVGNLYLLQEKEFKYNIHSIDNIEISANSIHNLADCFNEEYKTKKCNSFAVPLITAEVVKIRQKDITLNLSKIKEELWNKSINYTNEIRFYEAYNNLEWVNNALIFSMNPKEYFKKEFIFNMESIVHIKNNKLEKILKEIEYYLINNTLRKNTLQNIDTIILDFNTINMSNESISDLMNHFSQYDFLNDKNIVLINSILNCNHYFHVLKRYSKILYFNSLCENKPSIEDKRENPLIVIYHKDESQLHNILVNLAQEFKDNDYNVVTFSNSMRELFYGCKYLPLEHYCNSPELANNLNDMINYLNGDIGIIGVTDIHKDIDYINSLEEQFDIDIYIFKDSCGFNDYYKNIDLLQENNKKIILLSEWEQDKGEHLNINSLKENYIENLFNKILFLYDNDE